MARGLKPWIVGIAGGWAVAALALIAPPRESVEGAPAAPIAPWSWLPPEHRSVQDLAWEWRAARRALLAAEYRDSVERWLAGQATAQPALVFAARLSVDERRAARGAIDVVWRRLAPHADARLGIVIIPDTIAREPGRPRMERIRSPLYLLPTGADRPTCVVLLPEPPRRRARPLTRGGEQWLAHGLGPCAYYAAFGQPGPAIEAWLRGRRYDVAYAVEWATDRPRRGRPSIGEPGAPWPWYLSSLYAHTRFTTIACAAGRAEACRAELLRATAEDSSAELSGLVPTDYWWRRRSLEGAEWFLSDLVRDQGRERFGRFWRSAASVDSAFAAAFGEPIGDWTRRWQHTMLPVLQLGPATRPTDAGLGLLVAGLAAVAALIYVGRRQVA